MDLQGNGKEIAFCKPTSDIVKNIFLSGIISIGNDISNFWLNGDISNFFPSQQLKRARPGKFDFPLLYGKLLFTVSQSVTEKELKFLFVWYRSFCIVEKREKDNF